MPSAHIYLDYNASAPLRPEARAAMAAAWEHTGNASSVHRHGRQLHGLVESARETIAAAVNAPPAGVVFTASGTEANNLALAFGAERPLLVSAIEHDSVLRTAMARGGTIVPVTPDGTVDLAALDRLLAGTGPGALLSLMAVNNETGVIQPVAAAAALCRQHRALIHCDAVQALGRIPFDLAALDVDMASLSAHKIGGPQGVGALVLRDGLVPPPLLHGGGQERGRRPGTQNVAGIAGFAAAVAAAVAELPGLADLTSRRDAMERRLRAACSELVVVGAGAARSPGVSCLAVPGLKAETQVMLLDLAGVSVSAGAACSSGKVAPSHVLRAMGLDEAVAGAAIRVSAGWATAPQELESFAAAWLAMVGNARRAA
ncbi:MAG: cysteine desulfurase family protein [Alphaproteobacteria bacterium]